MERYCPPGPARFVPANKNFAKVQASARKFSVAEITFCEGKKIFCDFSAFMESEKASTRSRMKTKKTKMLISFKNTFCSKNRPIKDGAY